LPFNISDEIESCREEVGKLSLSVFQRNCLNLNEAEAAGAGVCSEAVAHEAAATKKLKKTLS